MKNVKTSELTGVVLDWAIAKCEGVRMSDAVQHHGYFEYHFSDMEHGCEIYCPSTNWAQGGPIIERESIRLHRSANDGYWWASSEEEPQKPISGPTPLIAAMRCYVASKIGETVEIPEELI